MHILRLVLFGLAAFAILALAVTLLGPQPQSEKISSPEPEAAAAAHKPVTDEEIAAARRGIEERLAATEEYSGAIERLRLLFPTEYDAFLTKAAARSAATGDEQNTDALITGALQALRGSHGILAAKADAPALDHVFVLQRAVTEAMAAEDPRLCVDFLYGGAGRDFLRFTAHHRDLVASFAIANIDAIKEGEIKQIEREQPTPADLKLLEELMRAKGLDTPAIEAVLDGKTGDPPIEDAELCRAGLIFLDALAELPEPERMRVYALAVELMARS
jgi:hypothetical protein